jgi:sRNA-binding carbon storage regulator CsrA
MVLKPRIGQEIVLGDATIIKVVAITGARVWSEVQSQEPVRVEQKGNSAVLPEGAD